MKSHSRNDHPIADYIQLLERIGLLIERNGCQFQKGILDNIILCLKEGQSRDMLVSNDIWGGSGSVTDCNLVSESSPQSKESARTDEREFCSLIAELAERILSDGFATERVKQVGGAFAMWAREYQNNS